MKRLALLIRRQDLALALRQRRLHALREQRAGAADVLDRCRARQASTRQYLQQLLTRDDALALDSLRLTQSTLCAGLEQIERLQAGLVAIDADIEAAAQDAARAHKRLDKLRELAAQRRRARREHERRLGWQALDEWVLNTRRPT